MRKLIVLWLFFLAVYMGFAWGGRRSFATTTRAYWNLQAYSWMKGHIDLVLFPRDLFDLSVYNNKVYIFWPPLPAVFALPFVLIGGINASDIYYTAFWASFCPVLLYLVLRQARKAAVIPKISELNIYLLVLFYAFGSVFFYLSVLGMVNFTSQIISQIPLLVSLLLLFKFIENQKTKYFVFSVIFTCLAFWARHFMIFTAIVHLLVAIRNKEEKRRLISYILFLVFLTVFIYGVFNYIRFGSFLETGLAIQNGHPRYSKNIFNNNLAGLNFFRSNIYYFFISPLSYSNTFPFIIPNPEGNSIFITSPLLLLIFGSIRILLTKRKTYLIYLLIPCVMIIFSFLIYPATGWIQFGYRYLLDTLVLLILCMAYGIESFPRAVVYILVFSSVVINTLGVFWFQGILPALGW